MRPHLSIDVHNVPESVAFYKKVFGVAPQKQTEDYAKFDLVAPALNFSLVSATSGTSRVNHLGIEVESAADVARWEKRLCRHGLVEKVQNNVTCCFARQDKVWITDPDGNSWEIFTVHEQLQVTGSLRDTGCCDPSCCVPKGDATEQLAACGCS